MDKQGFAALFKSALEIAVQNAEYRLATSIPRQFIILLQGLGYSGEPLTVDKAIDALYIDETQFYLIIDMAVFEVDRHVTKVFVRPSGHAPVPYERTWDAATGQGPFKQVIAGTIRVTQEQS